MERRRVQRNHCQCSHIGFVAGSTQALQSFALFLHYLHHGYDLITTTTIIVVIIILFSIDHFNIFTSEHQIYKYKYIYHHDDHYPRSIFVEMGLATSSLDLLQLLSNTLSYFDFAFSISSLHPPSTIIILHYPQFIPPIIITILLIRGIGSNRQHDGEISTLFFDIQRKTLSDCSWLQTHENATFATMTLLLR